MTDHADHREKTAAYALGVLDDDERRAFEAHLSTCLECAREVREFAEVSGALAEAAEPTEAGAHVREAILARVRNVEGIQRTRTESTSTRWLLMAASVALVASAGYTMALRTRVTRLDSELGAANARLAAAETTMAELRRGADSASRVTVILSSRDMTRVDLAGQAAAPLAGGRAFWSRSRGLVVTTTNLPPAASGKVYQLWMVTAQAKISAGLLVPDERGGAAVVLDSPPGVEPVAIAVTLEPAGGMPAPTGPMYLVGSL